MPRKKNLSSHDGKGGREGDSSTASCGPEDHHIELLSAERERGGGKVLFVEEMKGRRTSVKRRKKNKKKEKKKK